VSFSEFGKGRKRKEVKKIQNRALFIHVITPENLFEQKIRGKCVKTFYAVFTFCPHYFITKLLIVGRGLFDFDVLIQARLAKV
jgi:hypothetical protein